MLPDFPKVSRSETGLSTEFLKIPLPLHFAADRRDPDLRGEGQGELSAQAASMTCPLHARRALERIPKGSRHRRLYQEWRVAQRTIRRNELDARRATRHRSGREAGGHRERPQAERSCARLTKAY